MVKVLLKQKDPEDNSKWITNELYFDGYIKHNLDLGIQQLKDDFDQVWFIDGAEGAGKSDLMAQLAYYVNKPDTRHTLMERICLTAEQFDKAVLNAQPFEAVVLDEAFGAMSATGSMGKINRVLQRRFTEIRSKNLFIFIGAPSFMDIMRYFAIWRSKCLLHVYLGKGKKRGFVAFYAEQRKRKLYILGKKAFYNYNVVSPQFTARFIKQMHKVIDKAAYDKKKIDIQHETKKQAPLAGINKRQMTAMCIENLETLGMKLKTKELAHVFDYAERSIREIRKEMREKGGRGGEIL